MTLFTNNECIILKERKCLNCEKNIRSLSGHLSLLLRINHTVERPAKLQSRVKTSEFNHWQLKETSYQNGYPLPYQKIGRKAFNSHHLKYLTALGLILDHKHEQVLPAWKTWRLLQMAWIDLQKLRCLSSLSEHLLTMKKSISSLRMFIKTCLRRSLHDRHCYGRNLLHANQARRARQISPHTASPRTKQNY